MDVRHRHSESGKFSLAQRYSVRATAAPSPSLMAVVRARDSAGRISYSIPPLLAVFYQTILLHFLRQLFVMSPRPLLLIFRNCILFCSNRMLQSTDSRACARAHTHAHKNKSTHVPARAHTHTHAHKTNLLTFVRAHTHICTQNKSAHWHAGTRVLNSRVE